MSLLNSVGGHGIVFFNPHTGENWPENVEISFNLNLICIHDFFEFVSSDMKVMI